MWQGKWRNISFLQKHQGERCYKNSHTFCSSTVAGINCILCLEMFYLFWLSPHTGFSVSIPYYPFTHFAGFVASPVVFIGQWRKGLWCLLDLERGWLSVNSPGSLLALVRPVPSKTAERGAALCPWGNASYNWPIVFLQAENCSAGVPQRQGTVALRKL